MKETDSPFDHHLAHALPIPGGRTRVQSLRDHLESVAQGAAGLAAPFGASEWARLAGLWHDLGKYSAEFQSYLRQAAGDLHEAEVSQRVDHSSAGAQHAVARFPVLGHLLAFMVSGHHSGLLDTLSDGASLQGRLTKRLADWSDADRDILEQPEPPVPPFLADAFARKDDFAIQFFVRMVFSCLVDADFRDTEAFMSPEKVASRPSWPADILDRMLAALEQRLAAFPPPDSEVNRRRAEVLEACRKAATRPPGLFTLTVPTGGGKTLSSLAFALEHARRHVLRRVVYVVPFTSIIEQNAGEFRDTMHPLVEAGLPDPVIEHHSNLDPEVETVASRLSAENWDAPLVVTTSVQFYESLFTNRTSRCRKLHNLARAVVILDEAQTLPVDFLSPCLRALRELTANYGASVLLCTATQPAVQRRDGFPIGLPLDGGSEIIPEPRPLYEALRRVKVEHAGTMADESLAAALRGAPQALAVVNTRRHARAVWALLGVGDGHFHLSGLMCPEHRSEILSEIRNRLEDGRVCRVVSTQLVEAGVDLDFPLVFRSMAGLDSIAQAAGRCNRNGRLPHGRTVIFRSEHTASEAFLRDTAQTANEVLSLHADPLSLEAVHQYFRLYYWNQASRWDAKQILDEFRLQQDRSLPFLFGFKRAASRFRLIEDSGRPIIVPWGKTGRALCERLRHAPDGPSLELRRKLQRYTVSVPVRLWERARGRVFTMVHEQYPVLVEPKLHYSKHTGLVLDGDHTDALIV